MFSQSYMNTKWKQIVPAETKSISVISSIPTRISMYRWYKKKAPALVLSNMNWPTMMPSTPTCLIKKKSHMQQLSLWICEEMTILPQFPHYLRHPELKIKTHKKTTKTTTAKLLQNKQHTHKLIWYHSTQIKFYACTHAFYVVDRKHGPG